VPRTSRCVGWLATSVLALGVAASEAPAVTDELVVCGWDEVFVLEVSGEPRKVWSWKAADRPELPPAYREMFRTTDECKPVAGNRILITASSDGAALVDRSTGRTEWWGQCGNAHSAELLPGGRIVLACSTHTNGNRLALFDIGEPERELYSTELYSGHGVVWDAARERLWALGGHDLRAYALRDWTSATPGLDRVSRYPLPDPGGHDLMAVPGSSELVVSTHHAVWRFDRATGAFAVDRDLRAREQVKGVSVHPRTGRVAYVQAEPPNWWSSRIEFLRPDQTVRLDGQRLYKVRWVQ
jgi:hypothetical protein